jgi:hypothetical protein
MNHVKSVLRLLLVFAIVAGAVSAAPAVTEFTAADPTVYITKNGKKYHRGSCVHLRKSWTEVKLSQIRGKYFPCKECKPPS